MSSPKFAETHNVALFLEKPEESNGFAEIIDFLKASSVHYALTVKFCYLQHTVVLNNFGSTGKKKQPSKKAQRQEAELPQDEAEHEESVPTLLIDPQPSGRLVMTGELSPLMIRRFGVDPKDASNRRRSIEDNDADVVMFYNNEEITLALDTYTINSRLSLKFVHTAVTQQQLTNRPKR
ncbi:hypothetical protein Tco_0079340 [Tanacetum coccineum]